MQDKIQEFLTLGKKAKVLLGREDSIVEPRVHVLYGSDDSITLTFNSTCFPFFHENGFETLKSDEIDLFIEKCRIYVKKLESDVSLVSKVSKVSKEPKKKRYKDEDKINWFLIKTKDLKARIGVRISDSQAQAFEEGLDIKLNPSNSIVEKLDA